MCACPAFSIFDMFGSLKMAKSKPPAMKAPSRAGMPILVTMLLTVSAATPRCFSTYSR